MDDKNLDVAPKSRWLLPSLPLLIVALLFFSINILSEISREHALLVDLTVYQKASDFVAQGLNPYSPAFDRLDLRWQYPPFALLPLIPLHYVPWEVVVPFWVLTTAVLPLLMMIGIVAHRVFPNPDKTRNGRAKRFGLIAILALATATASPFINSTYLGQIGLILAAIVFFDLAAPDSWKTLGRFKLPQGIGVGIATAIKLTPGIFIVHLLLTRQWRPAITAMITVVSSWALAFIVFPAYSIYTFFEGGLFRAATENNVLRLLDLDNISAAAAFDRVRRFVFLENPETMAAWPKYAVILILALGVLFVSHRLHRNGQWMYALIVVGIGSALVSPVAWLNHAIWLTMLAPLMFLLGFVARRNGAYKTADRYFIAGVGFIALASFPSQFRATVEILPTPWDGLFIPLLMVGSIATLFILGKTKKQFTSF
jgi:alpha-1,2-mannosyltransferase